MKETFFFFYVSCCVVKEAGFILFIKKDIYFKTLDPTGEMGGLMLNVVKNKTKTKLF